MSILLLGCGGNAGINFVKSIKKHSPKIQIIGLDTNKYNIFLSNCDHSYHLPNLSNEDKVDFILNLCLKHKISFIHAQPDPEVFFLSNYANSLKDYVFELNTHDLQLCADKLKFQKLISSKLNLKYNTCNLTEVLDNNDLFNNVLGSNSVVWFRSIRGAGSKAALPISDMNLLRQWANYWIDKNNLSYFDFQISEFLPGPEYAVQTFWINGDLYHSQARQRLVYFFGNLMPSGQSSTPAVAKLVDDPLVYETAHKSILAVNPKPHGIYCVDMKTSIKNKIIPTEINYGRFFTTSDFFSSLGMNTPYALYSFHTNNNFPEKQINSLGNNKYWIRGLDVEPKVVEIND